MSERKWRSVAVPVQCYRRAADLLFVFRWKWRRHHIMHRVMHYCSPLHRHFRANSSFIFIPLFFIPLIFFSPRPSLYFRLNNPVSYYESVFTSFYSLVAFKLVWSALFFLRFQNFSTAEEFPRKTDWRARNTSR